MIVKLRSLHSIAMGRLKQKRSTGHSFVELVETEGRRGSTVRERVIPSSPLKRRASASPSKSRYLTPNTGEYPSTQNDDPPTPKRKRFGQKVSTLWHTWDCAITEMLIQSQNDFLREWVKYRNIYLQEVLSLEAPPPDTRCFSCQSRPGLYRCTDCIGDRLSCSECCCRLHQLTPYHRIKRWNGAYFERSDLVFLGLTLHVGHGGQECPSYSASLNGQSNMGSGVDPEDTEDEWEDETVVNPLDDGDGGFDRVGGIAFDHPEGQALWGPDIPGTYRLVVVTSTGIFRRRIRWCQCPGAADKHIQLLRLQLFSATIKRPSTAFTFDVLDHFHIDAMECKTAALNFYNKLRRLTSNAFPGGAPVSWWLECSKLKIDIPLLEPIS